MLVLTSVRKIGAVTFLAAVTIATLTHMVAIIIAWAIDAHRAVVGILIVSIMDTLRNGIILNCANVSLSAFSSRVSNFFALATLAERARARLLSMTGCFTHRAVFWAASVIRWMRFRATVSAYHEWSTFACHMSDCLAFATLAERA